MIVSQRSRNSLPLRLAHRGTMVLSVALSMALALTGVAGLAGCSEEPKVQSRRPSRTTTRAQREDRRIGSVVDDAIESEGEAATSVEQTAYVSPAAAPKTCAPDTVPRFAANSQAQVPGPKPSQSRSSSSPVPVSAPQPMSSAPREMVTLAEMNQARIPAAAPVPVDSDVVGASAREATSVAAAPNDVEALLRQAEEHNRLGLVSATKGAVFSARAEFLKTLRLVAAALDARAQTQEHSAALAAGLTALAEAEDFVPLRERPDTEVDISPAIRSHTTQIISVEAATSLTPAAVRELYAEFAVSKLAFAAAGSRTGSAALHRLGKIAQTSASQSTTRDARGKARAFLEAALTVDADNFPAANDLAVHLAEDGYYDQALNVMRDGLSRAPQPAMWSNLAAIHDRRGEPDLAQAARFEAKNLAGRGTAAGVLPTHNVAWVDARALAAASRPNLEMQSAATPAPRVATRATVTTAASQQATPLQANGPRPPISTALSPRRNAIVQ